MSIDFAVILNDQILYCSNDSQYPKFEIAIFSNILIKLIAENRSWILHKLVIKPINSNNLLKLLTRRYISSDGQNELILCLIGELELGSVYAYKLLDRFFDTIQHKYPIDTIQTRLTQDATDFKHSCNLFKSVIATYNNSNLNDDVIAHEQFLGDNQLIYLGISTNGLPIISKLFPKQSIFQIESPMKEHLILSTLSGQLATISMNAFIRAQCRIESIQIKISPTEDHYLFFHFVNFGANSSFTLEFLSTGVLDALQERNKKVTSEIINHTLFKEPFAGALKKYSPIHDYVNHLETEW